ncbi:MAG: hypothetical protein CBC13_03430 [Planctomycetia bacterium TMED53]|nr:MAG: hypothetical protein CBC13_03430 [Planctomycetia bacterium TMED53]
MSSSKSSFWDSEFIKTFGSLGLAAAMMTLLLILTFLGTMDQTNMGIYQAQKKYFESLIVKEPWGAPFLLLPGGMTCMIIFTLNLLIGGILRLRLNKNNLGVFVIHVGIALMMSAGLVKLMAGQEGYLRLWENQKSSEYISHHEWEVSVFEAETGNVTEKTLHEEFWRGSDFLTVPPTAGLPLHLNLQFLYGNCRPQMVTAGEKLPEDTIIIDDWYLKPEVMDPENERNMPGLVVWVHKDAEDKEAAKENKSFLWGGQNYPWTIQIDGKTWVVALRKVRHSMPFTIQLDNFEKVDYPGITMAKEFRSDVTQISEGSQRNVRIEMNDPLRDQGLILFQSSWGPPDAKPGDELFSVFAVVHNPSDHWPLYSCIIIALGMGLAFVQKFLAYGRRQSKRLQKEAS